MTKQEAIECMQYLDRNQHSVLFKVLASAEQREIIAQGIRLAISAIQESIEREKGCKDCTIVRNGKTLYKGSGMMWGYECCPHCGRELKTAMQGEVDHEAD